MTRTPEREGRSGDRITSVLAVKLGHSGQRRNGKPSEHKKAAVMVRFWAVKNYENTRDWNPIIYVVIGSYSGIMYDYPAGKYR